MRAIKILQVSLKEYNLELSDEKTIISKLPRPFSRVGFALPIRAKSINNQQGQKMKHAFTLEYWQDDGWYVGKLREVPGLFSQGETLEELVKNIEDVETQDFPLMNLEGNIIHRHQSAEIFTDVLSLDDHRHE